MTVSMAPMRIRPRTWLGSLIAAFMLCTVSMMCSAYSSTRTPSCVSDTPLESRTNSRTPISSSSAAIRLEMDAWVLNSFSAVRRKLLSRATQTKVSRNLRFTKKLLEQWRPGDVQHARGIDARGCHRRNNLQTRQQVACHPGNRKIYRA